MSDEQAFPSSNTPDTGYYSAGMTLRDYFAGKAIASLIATTEKFSCKDGSKASRPEQFAEIAYLYADAMLKAREA